MHTGRLKKYVSLKYKTVTRDESGAEIETWTTEDSIYACIEALSGREFYAAEQAQSEVDTKITIRYRRNVHAGKRIVYGARTFDIEAVLRDETNQWLTLMCIERP